MRAVQRIDGCSEIKIPYTVDKIWRFGLLVWWGFCDVEDSLACTDSSAWHRRNSWQICSSVCGRHLPVGLIRCKRDGISVQFGAWSTMVLLIFISLFEFSSTSLSACKSDSELESICGACHSIYAAEVQPVSWSELIHVTLSIDFLLISIRIFSKHQCNSWSLRRYYFMIELLFWMRIMRIFFVCSIFRVFPKFGIQRFSIGISIICFEMYLSISLLFILGGFISVSAQFKATCVRNVVNSGLRTHNYIWCTAPGSWAYPFM